MKNRDRLLTTKVKWANSQHTSLVLTLPAKAAEALKVREGDQVDVYLDLAGDSPEVIILKRKD